jgi:DNA polymerase-3 subunit gamma/tau
MLGTVRRDYLYDLLDALAARDGDALLAQARTLAERGIAFDAALQDLGNLLTQLALLLHAAGAYDSTRAEARSGSESFRAVEGGMDAERMQAAAAQLDAETVQLYYQIALNGRRDLPYAPDEFSGFCMTLLRMLAFAPGSEGGAPRPVAAARPAPVPRAEPAPRAAAPAPAPSVPPPAAPSVAPLAAAAPAEPVKPIEPPEQTVAPAAPLVASEPGPREAWDWLAVVADLRLGGMAKMLADHCELVSQAGDAVTLRVGEAHKHLLDRTYQDRLVGALRDRYGAALSVTFEVGAAAEQTPQQVRTRIREARQAEAVAAIESDPFVRELVDQFGGQVDASTIQPLGEHP